MRLATQFLPGDEFIVQELFSSVMFSPESLVSSFGFDTMPEVLKVRGDVLPFYKDNVAPRDVCNKSHGLAEQLRTKVNSLRLVHEEERTLLPLAQDWFMLPLLNAAASPTDSTPKLPLLKVATFHNN